MVPATSGINFALAAARCIDRQKDLIFEKSWYSAFKDGRLVQTLRSKLITEIFLCGALTNISVFATAMDAARFGYNITIVEDCLGYRNKARHVEAMRKLIEFTGCKVIKSEDLIEEFQQRANKKQATPDSRPRPFGRTNESANAGLEQMMAQSDMRSEGSSRHSRPPSAFTGRPFKPVAVSETVGSSSSTIEADEDQPPEPEFRLKPPEVKRERVKNNVKTRSRKTVPRVPVNTEAAAEEEAPPEKTKSHILEVDAILGAASKALQNLTVSDATPTSEMVSKERATSPQSKPTAEPQTSDSIPMSPAQQVEMEKNTFIEAGLTPLCEGDTAIIRDLLDEDLAKDIFEKVRDEVWWQKMRHQGGDVPRLVAVQGETGKDGSIPIYRHPADESPLLLPFSPTVSLIKAQAEKKLGHTVNHVLIQFYRDGRDYISEHSDKTLDISPNTFIANVSLGAQRTMVFRTKKPEKLSKDESTATSSSDAGPPRRSQRAALPHNSMCKMGLMTNMRWLHAIRQDKRMLSEKTKEELAFDGGRISLTFRSIGTFLDKDQLKIWGQGAVAKTKDEARQIINGDSVESEKMIRAFGKENHASDFDWKEWYGTGFDVLHINNSPKLFLSGDSVANARVKMMLAEHNIPWSEGKISPPFNWKVERTSSNESEIPTSLPLKFVENDPSRSTVIGDVAIMLYIDAVYGSKEAAKSPQELAKQYTRFHQCEEIKKSTLDSKLLDKELKLWEGYAKESDYIAGDTISIADAALWPILHDVKGKFSVKPRFPKLYEYYERLRRRNSVVGLLRADEDAEKGGD